MMNKISKLFTKATNLTTTFIKKKRVRESMQVIRLYAFLIFFCVLLFISGWGWNAYILGKFDLPIFTTFFGNLISPAGVATMTLISVFLIDKNHDGRPDAGEIKAKDEQELINK